MADERIGCQTPSQAFVLPYELTDGARAVEIYNSTGYKAQEWQELLLYDILAFNDDGLWVHTSFGYSLPRRNGKNEVVTIREMYGLMELGEQIMHTAHRTSTTHTAWERLLNRLKKAGAKIVSSYRASGKEHIELENGGKIEFRTRTSKGGLGEGYDLLVIDEAQEYQDDQETALKYVISDSANPQTIFLGTPPTSVSSGTVFLNFRNSVLQGKGQDSAWEEWGVRNRVDLWDKEAWYLANPALGTHLKERAIISEIGKCTNDAKVIDELIQRFGMWFQYNQKSAISEEEWKSYACKELPALEGKLFLGVKYSHNGESVSVAVAVRTADDRVFLEALGCEDKRKGNDWIISLIRQLDLEKVIIDGKNGQDLLAAELKDAKVRKKPILPKVDDIVMANSAFEQARFDGKICHMNQRSLMQSASNCEKRAIGSRGGFGYQSIKEGVDVSLLEAAVLAYWACASTKKSKKKQKVSG